MRKILTTRHVSTCKPIFNQIVPAIFTALALVAIASTASAQKRFQNTLRDAKGTAYTVYLQAKNEKRDKDHLDRNQISGDYYAYLRRPQWKTAQRQNITLFGKSRGGSFVPGEIEAFALRSKTKGQPDVLVVEEFGTASLAVASLFFIQNGQLQRISVREKNQPADFAYIYRSTDRNAIRSDGPFRYKTRIFDNSGEESHGYHLNTWRFDVGKKQFVWLDSKKDNPPNFPTR